LLPFFTFIKSKESEISFVVPSFSFEFTTSLTENGFDSIFQDYHFKTRHQVEISSPLTRH